MMMMWDELDVCVNIIKKPALGQEGQPASAAANSDVEYYKARASGIAYCLALLASPHFRTPEEISKEALDRWKMRNGEMEERPTPGYGGYNPPPPGTPIRSSNPERAAAASKPLTHNLTEQQIAGIRNAHKSAGFTEEQLAKAYNLHIALVKQILAEPEPA